MYGAVNLALDLPLKIQLNGPKTDDEEALWALMGEELVLHRVLGEGPQSSSNQRVGASSWRQDTSEGH